jgi:alpha-ribazole phosphatase
MDIVFVRHGSTLLNEKGIYVGKTDTGISQKGKDDIKKLVKSLDGIKFDNVYSSPLKRAIETTEIIVGKNYTIDARLREIDFGIFEGLSYKDINERYPEESKDWTNDYLNYKVPEGERLNDVFSRVEKFIKDIEGENNTALVVTHGGVIGCALSLVFNSREYFYRFKILHGTINVICIENNYMYIKGINCMDTNGLI